MTNPIPPGDNVPLYEGLGTEWNDIVGAFPEDKRAELAPVLKSKIDVYEPLKQYEDFHKSGISSDQIGTALNLFSMIENQPRQVVEAMAQHLGLTLQEAKQVAQDIKDNNDTKTPATNIDPRIATLEQQIQTLAQIELAKREQSLKEQYAQEADALIEKELNDLRKKYGTEIDEDEIVMRMVHKDISAEQAYQEYTEKVNQLRQRRPAPMVLGSSGAVPSRAIDPTKLNNAETKNLVAQMLQHGANAAKQ